ncbi:MAG: hypothetical protein RLZZ200_1682 [Pseudomonadota bacterium]|jgi:nucleoside-diphosphate-sugar epimerase
MKVLVTGAGGFVGREVLRILAQDPSLQVVAVDTGLRGLAASPRLRLLAGNITDESVREAAVGDGVDALVHLAAVPGGAAEMDPAASRRVNIDATLDLFDGVAREGRRPRVVFASTIAVFGDTLPPGGVDDSTPLAPRLIYGAHKAMIETMLSTLHRRGAVSGVSLRLPGIIARPKGPSGMKSAFMSNLFHALREGESFVSPVSPAATIWLMSVQQVALNLVHALRVDDARIPAERALTLPALRIGWSDLIAEVARQTGAPSSTVSFEPDAALEEAFGAYPPLSTPAAERAGFAHDGDTATLVARALEQIARL